MSMSYNEYNWISKYMLDGAYNAWWGRNGQQILQHGSTCWGKIILVHANNKSREPASFQGKQSCCDCFTTFSRQTILLCIEAIEANAQSLLRLLNVTALSIFQHFTACVLPQTRDGVIHFICGLCKKWILNDYFVSHCSFWQLLPDLPFYCSLKDNWWICQHEGWRCECFFYILWVGKSFQQSRLLLLHQGEILLFNWILIWIV